MYQEPKTKKLKVNRTNNHIPHKVTDGDGGDKASIRS